MKTKFITLLSALMPCVLAFSFCNSSNANSSGPSVVAIENDTALTVDSSSFDIYVGLYKFMNYYYSVGKFPENTRVHTKTGDKYCPLDKQFYGRYFLVKDNKVINRPFFCRTDLTTSGAGGYQAAETGNIIIGIAEDNVILIQNYDNYGSNAATDTLTFNLGGTGDYGKFVPRADGKYNLSVNNAIYEWTE
jgi:hypothetical protein